MAVASVAGPLGISPQTLAISQDEGSADPRKHLQIRILRHMHGPAGKIFDFPDHLLRGGVQGHGWILLGLGLLRPSVGQHELEQLPDVGFRLILLKQHMRGGEVGL